MAGRSGDASLGLLEALELSRQKYEQSQKAPNALKSRGGSRSGHNFADLIAQGDQNAQSAAFGLTDAIVGEGKRLWDGKFGFDALAESLPKLAQSGPSNLLQALETGPARVGQGWTNQDLQAQRDRDNLGQAAGGALDATWLAPAVGPAVRGGKAGLRALEDMLPKRIAANDPGILRRLSEIGNEGFPNVIEGRLSLRPDDIYPRPFDADVMAGQSRNAAPESGRGLSNENLTPWEQATPDLQAYSKALADQLQAPKRDFTVIPGDKPPSAPTTLNMGFGFGGKDGERSLAQMLGDVLRGRKAEPDAPLLPGASAPTSLDDLFAGGPTAPRPDGRTMSPQQIAHLANNPVPDNFDFAAPTAFERMSAADEVMKQRPQPEALDMQAYPYGDGLTDFNFPLPNGEMANVSGRLADGRLRIDYMNVPDSMQRQGYGTKMHEAIMDWARKNGAIAIDSDNVLSPGAVGLYESMKRRGFDITKNAEPRVTASGQVADGPIYSLGLGSTKKPLGYDDWSPEWKAAFDKGLPMDQASRMARAKEQGFNVDERLFHGTSEDFAAFDPAKAGDVMGYEGLPATFTTPDPKLAAAYAEMGSGHGDQIMPVFVRGDYPVRDLGGKPNLKLERDLLDARDLGTEGFRMQNTFDHPWGSKHDIGGTDTVMATFDPANIRSTSAAFDPANAGKPTLLGMGAPFEGKGEQPLLGALSDALSGKKGIKAYHGSPHDFDRFDMSKIGTGEGEQAYGHGLYFAENENVAKWYRDSLTTTADRVKDTARRAVNLDNGDTAKAVRYLRGQAKALQQQNDAQEALVYSGAADLIEQGAWDNPGKMYEVNINAEPEKFIDWDKAFSEQHPIVADTLNKMGFAPTSDLEKELPVSMWLRGSLKPETADALRKSGVPGVKYLDQSSRAAGDGSRNYVVFDDKLVDINRKYMGAGDSDLIKLLASYGAFGGMSAGALATLDAQKHRGGGF